MNPFARIEMAVALLACIVFLSSTEASAQQKSASTGDSSAAVAATPYELPDAPDAALPQQQPTSSDSAQPPANSGEGKQTKRILGIVPNFTSVSADSHLPAQTTKEKFVGFTQESFDYSSFVFVGLLSAEAQLQGSTPEFHTGPPAFARYYWHTFADQTDDKLWVGFLLPVALHQDPRYYTLGSGTTDKHNRFFKRAGYAFSRVLVTRTDAGGSGFNFSEVVGSGATSGISNLYYPSSNRTWTKTGQRWALNIGVDGATFVFREFWPDLNRAIFHGK